MKCVAAVATLQPRSIEPAAAAALEQEISLVAPGFLSQLLDASLAVESVADLPGDVQVPMAADRVAATAAPAGVAAPELLHGYAHCFSGDGAPGSVRCLVAPTDPAGSGLHQGNREVVFTSNHLVVAMQLSEPAPLRQQRIFQGHVARVSSIAVNVQGTVMASCEEGIRPDDLPAIRVWDFRTGGCLAVLLPPTPMQWCSVDLSSDGTRLLAAGVDNVDHAVVMVWDISAVLPASSRQGGPSAAADDGGAAGPVLLARQSLDYDVRCVRWCPQSLVEFVLCGKNCLRVHRLRGNEIRGMSVAIADKADPMLTELARAALAPNTFTSVAFDEMQSAPGGHGGATAYVASITGHVFRVDVAGRRVVSIFQAHNGAINSLDVRGGHCATGGDDRVVRIWPLDFNDYLLEAEHEGGVGGVAFDLDALTVCIGCEDGSLGTLSIRDKGYTVLMRSHVGAVHDLAVTPDLTRAATVSSDGTVRSWALPGLQQDVEFQSLEDVPLSIALVQFRDPAATPDMRSDPAPPVPLPGAAEPDPALTWAAAVGFASGVLRVFDLGSSTVLTEVRQHKAAVTTARASPDGRWLFTCDADGHICVYEPSRGFLPLKYLNTGFAGSGVPPAAAGRGRYPIAVSRDSSRMASLLWDREGTPCIVLFELGQLQPYCKITLTNQPPLESASAATAAALLPVLALDFSGAQTLFAARADGTIERYNAATGALVARSARGMGHQIRTHGMAADLSGKVLVTTGVTGDVRSWDAETLAACSVASVAVDGAVSASQLLAPSGGPLHGSVLAAAGDGSLHLLGLDRDPLADVDTLRAGLLANRVVGVHSGLLTRQPSSDEEALVVRECLPCTFGADEVSPSGLSLEALSGGSALPGALTRFYHEERGALFFACGRVLVVDELQLSPVRPLPEPALDGHVTEDRSREQQQPLATFVRGGQSQSHVEDVEEDDEPEDEDGVPRPGRRDKAGLVQRHQRFLLCDADVTSACWSRDGSLLLVGGADGSAHVFCSRGPRDPWQRRMTLRQLTGTGPVVEVGLSEDASLAVWCTPSRIAIADIHAASPIATLDSTRFPRPLSSVSGLLLLPGPAAQSLGLVTWGGEGCYQWTLAADYIIRVHPVWNDDQALSRGLAKEEVSSAADRANFSVTSCTLEANQVAVRLRTGSGLEVRAVLGGLLPESHPAHTAVPRVIAVRAAPAGSAAVLGSEELAARLDECLDPGASAVSHQLADKRGLLALSDGSIVFANLLTAADVLRSSQPRSKDPNTVRARFCSPVSSANPPESDDRVVAEMKVHGTMARTNDLFRRLKGEVVEEKDKMRSLDLGPYVLPLLIPSAGPLAALAAPEDFHGELSWAPHSAPVAPCLIDRATSCLVPPSGYVLGLSREGATRVWSCIPPGNLDQLEDLTKGLEKSASQRVVAATVDRFGHNCILATDEGALVGVGLQFISEMEDWRISGAHPAGPVRHVAMLEWIKGEAPHGERGEEGKSKSQRAGRGQSDRSALEEDPVEGGFRKQRCAVSVDALGGLCFTNTVHGDLIGRMALGRQVLAATSARLPDEGLILLLHTTTAAAARPKGKHREVRLVGLLVLCAEHGMAHIPRRVVPANG